MSNILFLNFLDGLDSTNTVTFSEVLDGGYSSNVSFDGSIDGEGSEQRIEKRISSIISKHIPEFTRTQNPLFVKFLRYYYEFLEQDFNAQELLQNINSYGDIDRTVPSFIYYFLQNYGSKIPTSALIDKRFLVKRLNDLYQSKGSQLSFQSLFRLLYNEEITINYPYENVLRASDGEFVSKFCIGINIEEGGIENIGKRFLTYNFNGAEFNTPIFNVKSLPDNKAEIQIEASTKAPNYVVGELVYVYDKDKNVLLKGNILPTINDYSILTAGSGFKLGKVYTINYGPATGSLLRVSKLTSNKGVAQVSFLNFGYDYPDNLELNILPNENNSKTVEPKESSTRGTTDEITILKVNNSDYFLENYVSELYIGNPILFNYSYDELTDSVDNLDGNSTPYYNITNIKNISFTANSIATTLTSNTIGTTDLFSANIINGSNGYSVFTNVFTSALVSNSTSYANIAGSNSSISLYLSNTYFSTIFGGNIIDVANATTGVLPSDVCTLLLRTGGLAKYPGSYTSSRGFISESDILLQDNLLNQPFAYQVQSTLDISRFYDVLLDLIHPAGYLLFNRRNIRSNVDISANVGTSFRETTTRLESFDGIDVSDYAFITYKYDFHDNVEATDTVTNSFNTTINDLLDIVDSSIPFLDRDSEVDTTDETLFSLNIRVDDTVDAVEEILPFARLLAFNSLTVDFNLDNVYTDPSVTFNERYFQQDYDLSTLENAIPLTTSDSTNVSENSISQDEVSQSETGEVSKVENPFFGENYTEFVLNDYYTDGASSAGTF